MKKYRSINGHFCLISSMVSEKRISFLIMVKFYLATFKSIYWGRRGRDHIVVGFTTTYAFSAYRHWCCEFESRSAWGMW